MWYCGWDGGGTKTEVCVIDDNGKEISRQSFGPLNPNGTDPELVRQTVREAVAFMRKQPGEADACGGLVIGVAGITNQKVSGILENAIRSSGWKGAFRLAGDHEIALAGAIEGHGAILIAGTGSVCLGRDFSGKAFQVGGCGWRIDDGGSGYAIGRDILAAVARAADHRDEPTALTGMVTAALSLPEDSGIRGIITWLYGPETGKKEIAAMTRLLPEALAAKDAAALRIAERAASDLAELAIAGWRKSGMRDGELAMAGSILQKIPEIRDSVRKKILAVYPAIRIIEPRKGPAEGAAEMAREKEGAEA